MFDPEFQQRAVEAARLANDSDAVIVGGNISTVLVPTVGVPLLVSVVHFADGTETWLVLTDAAAAELADHYTRLADAAESASRRN